VLDTVNGTTAYRLLEPSEELPVSCQGKVRVACEPPTKRAVYYNLRIVRHEWQRPETYDEGVKRYAMIAKAIERVAKEKERQYPPELMWKFLTTIAFHESGLRRDVHLGLGNWAIGDCAWRRVNDHRGKVRVPGTCRSHGLFQSLFSDPYRSKLFGWRARQITGLNMPSTVRATTVAAKHLDRLWKGCSHNDKFVSVSCVFAAYGGVRSAKDPRIQGRAGTFVKLGQAPKELDAYVRELLGLDKNKPLAAR
jgi:hypothetical protein